MSVKNTLNIITCVLMYLSKWHIHMDLSKSYQMLDMKGAGYNLHTRKSFNSFEDFSNLKITST